MILCLPRGEPWGLVGIYSIGCEIGIRTGSGRNKCVMGNYVSHGCLNKVIIINNKELTPLDLYRQAEIPFVRIIGVRGCSALTVALIDPFLPGIKSTLDTN